MFCTKPNLPPRPTLPTLLVEFLVSVSWVGQMTSKGRRRILHPGRGRAVMLCSKCSGSVNTGQGLAWTCPGSLGLLEEEKDLETKSPDSETPLWDLKSQRFPGMNSSSTFPQHLLRNWL